MNDPFRMNYRPLDAGEVKQVQALKEKALELLQVVDHCGNVNGGSERAMAKTKLEEVVMWATKAVTA